MNVEAATDPYTELLLEYYRSAAPVYDDWAGGVHRKTAQRLAQLAAVRPHDVVVDAGCGTGLVMRSFGAEGRRAARIVGIDISPAMLDIAHAQRPAGMPTAFGQGLVEDLLLRNDTADVVILGLVLADTAEPMAVLHEARRVLRHGGRVIVSVMRQSLLTEVDSLFLAELRDVAQLIRLPERPRTHDTIGEPHVLKRMLDSAGFLEIQTSSMVVGNHTENAHDFIELMRYESPWMYSMVKLLGPTPRERLERRLTGTLRFSEEGEEFRYHLPFTFAVATRP
ncbi:MAG: class I SAM-dependent methyltransferase [Candidatus Dormibacteria bacterium]